MNESPVIFELVIPAACENCGRFALVDDPPHTEQAWCARCIIERSMQREELDMEVWKPVLGFWAPGPGDD